MKYIIGGGLSGLIAGYYNPDYTVLTDSFGGFINNQIARKFVYLHATDATLGLINDLGIDAFVKDMRLGYYDTEYGLSESVPEGFGDQYLPRKIPESWTPDDVELSAPGDEFRAAFIDENIIDAMKNEVDSRIGWVHSIDDYEIEFGQHPVPPNDPEQLQTLEWDSIVSTVPAPTFAKLMDVDWRLESEPVTYAELSTIPNRYTGVPWNLLYVVDEVPYHRIMRNMLSGKYYAEARGEIDFGPANTTVHPTGVIHDEDLDVPFDGIEFLGRFAEWDSNLRQDHVIERAKEGFV